MYTITATKRLNPQVKLIRVMAPQIAKKAQPGQFVMLRVDEAGERIPLTIADHESLEGTITLVFQEVGATTKKLGQMVQGDKLANVAGPLGKPSDIAGLERVCVVGGGLGCAIAYPQAKALKLGGAYVDIIAGFRQADLVFFEDEMREVSDKLIICTDDGSYGRKGLVTDALKEIILTGEKTDAVIAIGPLVMMKYVSLLTSTYGIKTIVSMNPLMIDGTGMCGGCRVTVDGKTKFACVDGPDFDGHLVDFDEAIRRAAYYKDEEKHAIMSYGCRISGSDVAED